LTNIILKLFGGKNERSDAMAQGKEWSEM